MFYQIFFKIKNYILERKFLGFHIYLIFSLVSTYLLFKVLIKTSDKLTDLKIILIYNFIFFGIYGSHKKIDLKIYFVRFILSIIILSFVLMSGGKL